jgi:hypothetical protein
MDQKEFDPRTIRLISVTMNELPIEQVIYSTSKEVFDHWDITETPFTIPESEVTYPETLRVIHNDNSRYCSAGIGTDEPCEGQDGQEIADGPVVVAEEPEHFSAFVNGSNRSKIIVIGDSSVVQGDCDHYRDSNTLFLRSLYPDSPVVSSTYTEDIDGGLVKGRVFSQTQKLLAPDPGSVGKLASASTVDPALLGERFTDGTPVTAVSSGNFYDGYSNYHPNDVVRPLDPETQELMETELAVFDSHVDTMGAARPKLSHDGYEDAGLMGGVPQLMVDTGKDFVDIHACPSRYPGDLFGWSVSLNNDMIAIGSPFNGFDVTQPSWDDVSGDTSLLDVNEQGGAGAVYLFKKTGNGVNVVSGGQPWELTQKVRPSGVNLGSDVSSYYGTHTYAQGYLDTDGILNDAFGYAVSLDVEFLAVGSPRHDFETHHEHIYSGQSAFIRKEFDFSFAIPTHDIYELGDASIRTATGSGVAVINNGAVFTFEHRITGDTNDDRTWEEAEKLTAHGYKDRLQSDGVLWSDGTENDLFGYSVDMNRSFRGDSDYAMTVGSVGHDFPINASGVNLEDAGAAYSYDSMLRSQPPTSNQGGTISAVAGMTGEGGNVIDRITLDITQNTSGPVQMTQSSGLITANGDGEIFLEVTGHDNADNTLAKHRPYIQWIRGALAVGTEDTNYVSMYTNGAVPISTSQMNLHLLSQESDIVYNSLGLSTKSAYFDTDSINLVTSGVSPTVNSGVMNLYSSSGVVLETDILNLAVRGK